MTAVAPTATQERAISLLGQGLDPSVVATALGVTPSTISQILADSAFAAQIATLRYENLVKHNSRDLEYDKMEDLLLAKLHDLLPFMTRPMEVIRSLQVINAAKRRGTSSTETLVRQNEVVKLVIPVVLKQKVVINGANQVVQAGDQTLVTIASTDLKKLASPSPPELIYEPASVPAAAQTLAASGT